MRGFVMTRKGKRGLLNMHDAKEPLREIFRW